MRKTFVATIVLLLSLCVVFFAACSGHNEKYVVTFHNGDEVFYSESVEVGESFTFPSNEPTKASDETYDYVFKGWSKSADGEIITVPEPIYEDTHYYAVYDAVEKEQPDDTVYYKVTFIDGFTHEQFDEQQVEEGSDAKLPTPPDHTADGYEFDTWSGSHLNIRHNTEITALYKEIISEPSIYTVTEHILGQTRKQTFNAGAELKLDDPTVDTFLKFEGWYEDEEFEREISGTVDGDRDVYAKVTVNFDGATLIAPENMVYGKADNKVTVSGLSDQVDYTFAWKGGSDLSYLALIGAGEYEVQVTVSAEVSVDEYTVTGSRTFDGTFTVAKAPLTAELRANASTFTYGVKPEIALELSGFVNSDNAESINANYQLGFVRSDSADGEGEALAPEFEDKLPVGFYTVSVELDELANYEVGDINDVEFSVTKKTVDIDFEVENYVYGDELSGDFSFVTLNDVELAYEDELSVLGTPVFTVKNGSILTMATSNCLTPANTPSN